MLPRLAFSGLTPVEKFVQKFKSSDAVDGVRAVEGDSAGIHKGKGAEPIERSPMLPDNV